MLKLISLLLIFCIVIFVITYKKKFIFNKLKLKQILIENNSNQISKTNLKQVKNYSNNFNLNDLKFVSNSQKAILKKEMFALFKGSKDDKIKALKIAQYLSNRSTLPLLKLGLKDMDMDIVKFSAKLIQKFK